MTTVLITGAGGFIARNLAPVLRDAGMRVVGTSRREGDVSGFAAIYRASLGDALAPALGAERVDAVVHAALDSSPDAYATNVDGTTRWLAEAQAAGVPLQILLSTLSADATALSDYGRAKHVLEQRFVEAGQVVFRLGVVVGDGGMFARMVDATRRSPIVPLLDGGRQPVFVLGIDFLCQAIRDTIARNGAELRGRAWNLQQPQASTLREVTEGICRRYDLRRLLIPVPAKPILIALLGVERLPFPKLPITSTNLRGLIQSRSQSHPSDFARFGYPAESLDGLIGRVA